MSMLSFVFAVRIKNMFLFDEDQAKKQFYYRTVMINWLYTPGITYKELAEESRDLWQQYLDYTCVSGYGDKDPSESWSTWYACNVGGGWRRWEDANEKLLCTPCMCSTDYK